jgi:hypothetical protein
VLASPKTCDAPWVDARLAWFSGRFSSAAQVCAFARSGPDLVDLFAENQLVRPFDAKSAGAFRSRQCIYWMQSDRRTPAAAEGPVTERRG